MLEKDCATLKNIGNTNELVPMTNDVKVPSEETHTVVFQLKKCDNKYCYIGVCSDAAGNKRGHVFLEDKDSVVGLYLHDGSVLSEGKISQPLGSDYNFNTNSAIRITV